MPLLASAIPQSSLPGDVGVGGDDGVAKVDGVVPAPDRDPLDVARRDVLRGGEHEGDVLAPELAQDGDAAVAVGVRSLWVRRGVPEKVRRKDASDISLFV